KLNPAQPRRITCDPASLADPYSLVQGTGVFPVASAALKLQEAPAFAVLDDAWRIENPQFTFTDPAADLLKGGEWTFSRQYQHSAAIQLDVNSSLPTPWNISVPPSELDLHLPMLPAALQHIFRLRTNYTAASGSLPSLAKPTLEFVGALE